MSVEMRDTIQRAIHLVASAGDEVFPLATRRIAESAPEDAEEAEVDFAHAVDEAYVEWATTPTNQPEEKRAALLRLMAATAAALAVDEAVRGGEAIERETWRLNDDGRLS